MARFALSGASVFDGEATRGGTSIVVAEGSIEAVCRDDEVPDGTDRVRLDGGLLAPGFIDVQVNGGGGVLLNEGPTVAGIRAICEAHRRYGSTAMLPTVITDEPAITLAAIDAVGEAMRQGIPGCIGIHVEGPFIARSRKGAHDPALIRTMEEADLASLASAAVRPLLLTVAPALRLRRLGLDLGAGGVRPDLAPCHPACLQSHPAPMSASMRSNLRAAALGADVGLIGIAGQAIPAAPEGEA